VTTGVSALAISGVAAVIRFGDTDIYSDFAQYDSAKRTVYLQGHVRIYRGVTLYTGEKATYNLDTKAISAEEMRSGTYPYLLSGKTVTSDSDEEYTIKNGSFTTDDSSQPDFHLNAGLRVGTTRFTRRGCAAPPVRASCNPAARSQCGRNLSRFPTAR
jgi:hypothetical protein